MDANLEVNSVVEAPLRISCEIFGEVTQLDLRFRRMIALLMLLVDKGNGLEINDSPSGIGQVLYRVVFQVQNMVPD